MFWFECTTRASAALDVHIYEWDDWAKKTIPVPMAMGEKLRSSAFPLGHVDGLAAGRLQYAYD
jgi:threonine 3-dehydrogenase